VNLSRSALRRCALAMSRSLASRHALAAISARSAAAASLAAAAAAESTAAATAGGSTVGCLQAGHRSRVASAEEDCCWN
jgi:hypothetical protein